MYATFAIFSTYGVNTAMTPHSINSSPNIKKPKDILRNKKIALAYGLTTLYSILIFFLPFFTTASDSVEGITGSDYWHDFTGSFIICLVICLIVLVSLILPLLIRKKGKSALSLLEKGGVITNVKIEILVVIFSNIALIVTTYMMVLSEMNRLGSH